MSEQPTNAELARRLDRIDAKLDGNVGRFEYEADKRGDAQRFTDMAADIAGLRADFAEHQRSHRENSRSWREIIWPMLGAAVASGAGFIVQMILANGGH